ncbi:MAG: hypothetical protein KME05_16865 [Gloeocapsa sp. UFS-A4-WI-NPMV-4B04]|nr:hypothetical protein [Gloeocapsa sp. UFS-A4-WI-NPMV-4B04]
MSVHIFGIRHHGPGSARSLRDALEQLQPDAILVEGPPDADPLLPLLTAPKMQPPVALLLYVPDQPHRCVYYPFAVFSPELQALHYGLTNNIPVRFIDLPQAHQLADKPTSTDQPTPEPSDAINNVPNNSDTEADKIRFDPLGWLGKAAGYSDGERWWEHMVEQRRNSVDLFAAILEAMSALRGETQQSEEPIEAQREAYMRSCIRAASESYQKIAVVCGAWHSPALAQMPPEKEDNVLLKGLPKIKVQATWVPWTYGRLAYSSGYGAGVQSPGWYHHLWTTPDQVVIRWIVEVAQLLREQDLDASSANLIEAVRLAESLAALRDRPLAGLAELNEATQAVLCFGSDLPMRLIHEKLIVGERLGEVPDDTPMIPLQQDLVKQQKRLRMPAEVTQKTLDLDLRKPNDLERSHLLHRLTLLGIAWGELQRTSGKKGTFHELWRLQWQPEFVVTLISSGIWGNTISEAAASYARDIADRAKELPILTRLLNQVLLADLPHALSHLMTRLQTEAAIASDIAHLMAALPPLTNILRYGNVRKTDTEMVSHVVDGLVARICIGLPGACASLDDDAATAMYEKLNCVNSAITLLQNNDHLASWHKVLTQMSEQGLNGIISGRCCRLLLDAGKFDADEAARRMGLALSTANEPPQSAAWVEGFLKGSGLLLLHDDKLWQVLDSWVSQLSGDTFTALLPLLRRTFSTFSHPERRQMGERVKRGNVRLDISSVDADFDQRSADAVLPIVAQLLGVSYK